MGLRQVPTRLGMNSCFGKRIAGEVLPEAGISRFPEKVKLTNNKMQSCTVLSPRCVPLIFFCSNAASLHQFHGYMTKPSKLTFPVVTWPLAAPISDPKPPLASLCSDSFSK